jgi:PAS domain S-box-containing protein
MTEEITYSNQSSERRKQAEEKVRAHEARTREMLSPEEAQRILHELRVHQIELELQTEELRRAQEELEASREQYFDLYDLAPIGYLTLNIEGHIPQSNLAAATLLGIPRNGLLRQPLHRFIVREDRDIYYLYCRQVLTTDSPQACELRLLKKDAGLFWARLEATMAQDADGASVIRLVVSNINDSKQAEKELTRLNKELQAKIIELEDVLFAASHDLRSPMINIVGFSQALEKTCKEFVSILEQTELSEDLHRAIEPLKGDRISEPIRFIHASAAKMESLIGGLLRLSRLGRSTMNIESLNMDLTLANVLDLMKYLIKAVECEIIMDPLPKCQGDANQIDQVFSNLLDNAIKYRDSTRLLKIQVSGFIQGQESVYCIEDNGIGIPQNRLANIWKLFYRIDPKSVVPGEGLGLTLIYRIVERHNGRVWVESEEGVGSKFFVALPR